MSRYSGIIFIILSFLFIGCSPKYKDISSQMMSSTLEDTQVNEDFITLEALMNKYYDDDNTKAIYLFKSLYDQKQQLPYLKEAITLAFRENRVDLRNEYLDEAIKKYPRNTQIMKLQVSRLLQEKKYEKAKRIMLKILRRKKTQENYIIVGSIYYMQKNYKKTLYYYNLAYEETQDEDTLIKIATVLDEKLNKRKRAIQHLETHIKMKDSSRLIYFKLLQEYSKDKDVEGLISTYKMLYKKFGDDEYAKKIVELYMYDKNKKGAIGFLENTGFAPKLLMDFYTEDKKYSKAYKLAQKMYKETNNKEYLGRMAIYQYEANRKGISKKILKAVSKKFEEVLKEEDEPLYLNYYGYLLIDHNLDVKKGIKYVKKALVKEPESIYYIDSLAWGYYKLGKCKEALKEIEKIINKTLEQEILDHYEKIKKCKGKH